ncbi:MAG: cysteine desulfurase [Deltaproteobacteria bacterium]|jgi:cysteine desulfurase|nr:cysteine desulfurase [Deltaproteobacteria bacterium]
MSKNIYADNAATTKVSERALAAMLPFFRENFGNPSAIYDLGQSAKKELEAARKTVASCLGAMNTEIFFTSGGTESDNWAIMSVTESKKDKGRHIISTAIEHNAVLKTLEKLEGAGFEVTYLIPDKNGLIEPSQLEKALRRDTILVSIMLANNVVGTIEPIKELARVSHKSGVLFHTDAVQAVGHIPINVRDLGVDFLSLSAHKFHGPKGVGALFAKLPKTPTPYVLGGGQERGGRSGTENVPGAVGLGVSLQEATDNLTANTQHLTSLRERLINSILEIPRVSLTGERNLRLPGHASFVLEGIGHGVFLINQLNELGISVSSGSACSVSSREGSHVLEALGYHEPLLFNALRITLCPENTSEEIDYILEKIPGCVADLRQKKFGHF